MLMLIDLIRKSRSYRSFDPSVAVSREQLLSFVECARLSPSSINLQMLKFRLVFEENECEKMLANTRWAGKLKDVKLPPEGHAPRAYIVICADTSVIETAANFQKDVGICAQSIMLAAAEAGLGGCMIGSFSPKVLASDLDLPSHLLPQLVLALGKPDEAVELTTAAEDGSVTYYREGEIHFVQKRSLEDLIL